jgi:hypothetical protein
MVAPTLYSFLISTDGSFFIHFESNLPLLLLNTLPSAEPDLEPMSDLVISLVSQSLISIISPS